MTREADGRSPGQIGSRVLVTKMLGRIPHLQRQAAHLWTLRCQKLMHILTRHMPAGPGGARRTYSEESLLLGLLRTLWMVLCTKDERVLTRRLGLPRF
jgi:hypothetical protein